MSEPLASANGQNHPPAIYETLVNLAIHGQDNKLNLFTGFLFFQSVYLLAWVTVWQMNISGRNQILFVLSVFGTLSSILWAMLGLDYADAARKFGKAAAALELGFGPTLPRVLTDREGAIEDKPSWLRSKFLIAFVTWSFVIVYPVLELIVWCFASQRSVENACN